MSSVNLSCSLIKAILQFACKDETRFHLNGIHFDAAGAAVATDGHSLVAVKVPAGWSGTIRTADLVAACRTAGAGGSVTVSGEGDAVALACHAKADKTRPPGTVGPVVATLAVKPISGQFPPWRQIVPSLWRSENREREYPSVQPKFLSRLEALAAALGSDSVKLTAFGGDLDPIRYDIASVATVVIMPMRATNRPAEWPAHESDELNESAA